MRWIQAEIGCVCIPTEQVDPANEFTLPFMYVDISSVDREQKSIGPVAEVMPNSAPSRARKKIRQGDILVSTVRPNLNAVAMVPEHLSDQIASTGFSVLRANTALIDPRFLFYWIQTKQFIESLLIKARGANYPAVSDLDVRKTFIPLPPLSEQRRIVEILDQADALRKKRREADALMEKVVPALFVKMFGDPFQGNHQSKKFRLGDLLLLMRNGTTVTQIEGPSGSPVTRIETISKGVIDPSKVRYVSLSDSDVDRWKLLKGDILFSHINSEEHIGKNALYNGVPEVLIHGMNLLLLRPNPGQIVPEYLWAMLNSRSVRAAMRNRCKRAVNQASLNQTDISSMEVFVGGMEMQERFAALVAKYELIGDKAVRRERLIDDLFASLMQRSFDGTATHTWREGHVKELLQEMEEQAKVLGLGQGLST